MYPTSIGPSGFCDQVAPGVWGERPALKPGGGSPPGLSSKLSGPQSPGLAAAKTDWDQDLDLMRQNVQKIVDIAKETQNLVAEIKALIAQYQPILNQADQIAAVQEISDISDSVETGGVELIGDLIKFEKSLNSLKEKFPASTDQTISDKIDGLIKKIKALRSSQGNVGVIASPINQPAYFDQKARKKVLTRAVNTAPALALALAPAPALAPANNTNTAANIPTKPSSFDASLDSILAEIEEIPSRKPENSNRVTSENNIEKARPEIVFKDDIKISQGFGITDPLIVKEISAALSIDDFLYNPPSQEQAGIKFSNETPKNPENKSFTNHRTPVLNADSDEYLRIKYLENQLKKLVIDVRRSESEKSGKEGAVVDVFTDDEIKAINKYTRYSIAFNAGEVRKLKTIIEES